MQPSVNYHMTTFGCNNLHHYLLEHKYSKKALSKTTINNSGDISSSFSYQEHNRSMSPSKTINRSNTTVSDDGNQTSTAKFVFKKDLYV